MSISSTYRPGLATKGISRMGPLFGKAFAGLAKYTAIAV